MKRKPSRIMIVCTLLLLLAGTLTFLWQTLQRTESHADSNSVVGPPTLPAATINAIFKSVGSPMNGTGAIVEEYSRKTNIDDAFAMAVWWAETNDGMAGVGLNLRNPGGVATSGGYKPYASYEAAVIDWFTIVKSRYINAGLTSIYTICRPYVGTATACSSSGWAGKVFTYTQKYRGMAPPPTPTPTPALVSAPVHGGTLFEQAAPTAQVAQVATNKTTSQTTVADAEQAQRVLAPLSSIAVGLILLLALAIAAWGTLIIQGIPQAGKKKLEGEDDAAICPPVYTSQLPSLSDSNPLPAFQPITRQYTMSGPQKAVTQQTQGGTGWQPSPDFIETQAMPAAVVNTEHLPSQPPRSGLSLPGRTPVPLAPTPKGSSGGLLRRYQNQQSQELPAENHLENS